MKRLLAILCTLALVLSVINPAVFAAENSSLQAAVDDDFSEIIVLEEDTSNLTVNRDTTIDLNGHSIDGVTVTGGTLYCLDSQTADYTVADGVYGHVTNVTGAVKAAEGYLQVGDSFHAVNLDIYAMTLRAANVGVYYKSNFAADEIVAAQVESFGVALSVVTAPNASNLDSYCGYSVFEGFEAGEGANSVGTSTLLKGIMKEANGDNKNAKNAAMPIYGRAYIKTADGYVFGETVKRSLQQQVEAIDGVWASLTDAQKAPVLGMLEGYTSVMEGWNIPNIKGGEAGEGAGEITVPVEVTTENGVVTETVTVEKGAVSITVPAGVKLAEGANKLTLTVTPVEAEDTGLTLKEDRVLIPMDVHVEGVAADNAQPITIYLGKIMPENLNMGNYTVYHVENGNANEMTLIGVNEQFTAHNQYKYTLDGELTLYMASFSVVAAEVDEENAWNGDRTYDWYTENPDADTFYIRNADQLAGFGAIVGGMAKDENGEYIYTETIGEDTIHSFSFADKTVMLTADISIGDLDSENDIVFYPIGYYNDYGGYKRVPDVEVNSWFKPFAGDFDGNGNTISNFYQNTWEMFGDYNDGYAGKPNYYREGMGLFGKVYGGTVRNLNVRNFSCDSEHGTSGVIASYADCGATFENIAIFDCNPRVYNIGNGGIVGCAGWYAKIAATEKVTFRNITVDNTNKISALWDASGTSAGGILGQYYPNSGQSAYNYPANPGVHFENCRISAILEVNNDCISNYHYYWYRYTGMLMGSVRANKKDATTGHLMADTTGITAENCEVSFGYWNEFWYCELVKNTIASYTHDHQFSRLTSITDVSQIKDENGNWNQEGNFALLDENRNCTECFHIFKNAEGNLYRHYHDVADETNGNEPYEVVNGVKMLKEDRQRYLLPFNQILTGDGMGILAHQKFEGVTIVEKDAEGIRASQEKFVAKDSFKTGGGEVKLSDIFTAKAGTNISVGSVQAYISPVGEDSTVKPAACVISDGNWEDGILNIEGYGAAKITITDYWYCTPTTLYLTVKSFTDPLTFLEDGKTAFCPSCEKYVEWIEVTNENKDTLANDNGDLYFGAQMPAGHHHFYLSNDVTYEETEHSFIYSNTATGDKKVMCFHLNGHNLTATSKAVAQIGIDSELNMMGTGNVCGNNQKTENVTSLLTRTGATIVVNGNDVDDPGTVRLYSGTYYQQEGNGQESTVSTVQLGATLEIYDDVTINALDGKYSLYVDTSNGSDGNPETVTIYGGTFNNTVMVKRCSKTATSLTQLQICGGTFNQGVEISVENMLVLTLSGAPKILGAGLQLPDMITANTYNGTAKLDRKLSILLGELKEGAQIAVSATKDQPFTVTNENADKYSQYFYSLADGYGIQAENDQLVCKALTYADKLEFRPDGTAWCMACEANVAWEDVSNVPSTVVRTGSHYHYYVPENMTLTSPNAYHFQIKNNDTSEGNDQVCLHLNGKTLTLTKIIYNALSSTLNIMGGGEIVGAAEKPVFQSWTATINLYGGTYKAGSDGGIIKTESGNAKVNLYEDAEIQGQFAMTEGKLWLNDTATMSDLNIAGGLATFCDGWTGSVNLTVAESLLTNGVVSTKNAKVESAADGKITSSMGEVTVNAETGEITITTASAEE